MILQSRKKALKLLCMIISAIFAAIILLAFPGSIFADYTDGSISNGKMIIDNGYDNSVILSEVKSTSTDTNFLPVLITSIVVLGILIFAMWQTFKSKRIY